MSKTTTPRYTYADFASEVIKIMSGEVAITPEISARVSAKASDLLGQQVRKAEYSATHPSTKAPKGASAETKAKADAIAKVLTAEPMTASEISTACGVAFTALQVANACKFITGVKTTKVVRTTVNGKGLKSEREYTAYSL